MIKMHLTRISEGSAEEVQRVFSKTEEDMKKLAWSCPSEKASFQEKNSSNFPMDS